jgi:hypothetical protein
LLDEGLIKRAQARVPNRHCGFRDVHAACAQQISGALNPTGAQILWNAHTSLSDEDPAEMERGAAYVVCQHFQGRGILEIAFEKVARSLDAIVVLPMMFVAKEFVRLVAIENGVSQDL